MDVRVNPVHEEFAARLGQAGTTADAAQATAILDEIGAAGVECALAVLAVQSRNLVMLLSLMQGRESALQVFDRTVLDAGQACDE